MSIKIRTRQKLFKNHVFKGYFVYFQFLLHNSHDKFDIQIIVLNQINHEESKDLGLGSKKSLLSPRLKLMAQGMVQCTNEQSQV